MVITDAMRVRFLAREDVHLTRDSWAPKAPHGRWQVNFWDTEEEKWNTDGKYYKTAMEAVDAAIKRTAVEMSGYVNIYKSGVYHTPGKPGAYNMHAGDVYPSYISAYNAREENNGYLATVALGLWTMLERQDVNP